MQLDMIKKWNYLQQFSPEIRSRLFGILALVFCIVFLIYFDLQHGFTSWEAINSKLSIFVAINVNIVLLVLVFYLILKNLLKLLFERRRQVLGVTLKTKLIIAFILISFPATLSHLFSTLFTYSTLESWMSHQREATIQNAQSVSQAYYLNLQQLMRTQGWTVENIFASNPEIIKTPERLNEIIEQGDSAGVSIYSQTGDPVFQFLRTRQAQEYWKPLTATEWKKILDQPQVTFSENLGNRLMYRHLRKVGVTGNTYFIEVLYVDSKHITDALDDLDEQKINTQVLMESEELIKNYYIISLLLMVFLIVFVATWFAFYLAGGFVRPIEQLAEATQRVAQGELGYQVVAGKGKPLDRDFGQLVHSFNSMSQQLQENQLALERATAHLQKSHRDLEEHSRFVDLVLENVKTGVVSLDMEGRINSLNRAAKSMLQLKKINYEERHYVKFWTRNL